jgi:hypothetical protein
LGPPAPAEIARRADELGRRLLAPLVLGGTLRLVRPLGSTLALALAAAAPSIADLDLASRIDVARVRRARLLAPIDTLPPPGPEEWALVAALNDLLQATNHELSGPLTRGRHARLLASVLDLCGRVSAPRTVGDALARHATPARTIEVLRTDTRVAWWTGTATFRGQAPPGRLLKWPELRRVQVEPRSVGLADMADGLPAEAALAYDDVLGVWLARSPLTDLASAGRVRPAFGWSRSTLSLVAIPLGRTLALRALARQPREPTMAALERATRELPREAAEHGATAQAFVDELAARPVDATGS